MQSTSASVASDPKLPAGYPVSFRAGLPAFLTGSAIFLSLGALSLLWPSLASCQDLSFATTDALWNLVEDSLSTLRR